MRPSDFPGTRAVVFDCFGTLVEIGRRLSPYEALARQANSPGFRRDALTCNESIETLAARYGRPDAASELASMLHKELQSLRTFPDAEPTLGRLADLGIAVAVCSNLAAGYGTAVRSLLTGVETFVFSFELGAVKPEPAIYAEVCGRLGLGADQVLFVGDSRRCDVDGPLSFGMAARHLDRTAGRTLLDALALR